MCASSSYNGLTSGSPAYLTTSLILCNACGYISNAFGFDYYMGLAIRNYRNGVIKSLCLHCHENDMEFPILI